MHRLAVPLALRLSHYPYQPCEEAAVWDGAAADARPLRVSSPCEVPLRLRACQERRGPVRDRHVSRRDRLEDAGVVVATAEPAVEQSVSRAASVF